MVSNEKDTSNKDTQAILDELIDLQLKYSSVHRKTLTAERISIHKSSSYQELELREPLIEHVGHLPIIATSLYPYFTNIEEIKIGKVLVMLALHDISETKYGDILDYDKTVKEGYSELERTLLLVDKTYQPYVREFFQKVSKSAKFANSIDKLAPHLHELTMPRVDLRNYMNEHGFGIDDIKNRRRHFEWNDIMSDLFKGIVLRLQEKIS